jgi:hypothetical protein
MALKIFPSPRQRLPVETEYIMPLEVRGLLHRSSRGGYERGENGYADTVAQVSGFGRNYGKLSRAVTTASLVES